MIRRGRHKSGIGALGRFLLQVGVILAVVSVTPRPGAAQQPSKEEVRKFRKHVANGVKHYKEGHFYRALENFDRAREIAEPPSLLYKIGRARQAVGACDRARELYEKYLDADLPDEKRQKGNRRLSELEANCPQRGTLKLTCKPEAAEATAGVGDRERECPMQMALEGGTHEVSIRAEGHPEISETVEIEPGVTNEITIDLAADETDDTETTGESGMPVARWLQIGGIAAGAGLLAGGVVTDLATGSRLEEMEQAENAGNRNRFQDLQEEGKRATVRAAIFYSAGTVLGLGSGVWLVVDTAGSSNATNAELGVTVHPTGITGHVRW